MAQTTKQSVLAELLQDATAWHSGDEIAQKLNLSRESVWKAINALRKSGHNIVARKSQGYRYEGTSELNADVINFYAPHQVATIKVAPSVTSTQDVAKTWLAAQTELKPAAFLADEQTNGYGRRGRDFYSPKATGLYLSLVLPNVSGDLSKVGLLTTGVATAVVRTLHQFFPDKDFGLKWVNDVYLGNKKVAGILCEAVLELESASSGAFVIGVGLNLATKHFPQALSGVAGAIATGAVDRNRFAAALIQQIMTIAKDFETGSFLPEYRSESITIGHKVTLALGERKVVGKVTGIADDGGLILQTAQGQQTFNSGEVTKVEA